MNASGHTGPGRWHRSKSRREMGSGSVRDRRQCDDVDIVLVRPDVDAAVRFGGERDVLALIEPRSGVSTP
jgi:hypothetical protein